MLEHEETDESCHHEHKERDIGIDGNPIEKETFGVLKEYAL